LKKAFHIFFTIYFFALVITPCADKEDCNEFKQTELSQNAHQQQHSDEVCTPFCACACCAAHFLMSGTESHFEVTATISTIYTDHATAKITEACSPIWQPPKLA